MALNANVVWAGPDDARLPILLLGIRQGRTCLEGAWRPEQVEVLRELLRAYDDYEAQL